MDPASLDNQCDLFLIFLKQLHLFQWVPVNKNDVSQFSGFDGSKIFLFSEKLRSVFMSSPFLPFSTISDSRNQRCKGRPLDCGR